VREKVVEEGRRKLRKIENTDLQLNKITRRV
jgi:hypothetical protein